jgi:hypothetical protein
MFRFSVRELCLLTFTISLGVALWLERSKVQDLERYILQLEVASKGMMRTVLTPATDIAAMSTKPQQKRLTSEMKLRATVR